RKMTSYNLWTTLTKQLSENRVAEQSAIHMVLEMISIVRLITVKS
ncbi:2699_t:CDS:1, partial [Rhizophagus irregularis]